jgi:protoporphyrinogen oxidase
MDKNQKYTILGAGLAGLSAAFFLKRDFRIFEREAVAGGLCRCRHIKGYTFDYDGHLLHFRNKGILDLVQGLMENDLVSIKRNSWVNSFGCYTRYPFQANLFGLPKRVIKECVLGFILARLNSGSGKKKQVNFRQWILSSFGSGIAGHFMLPYNRKFWTVPAHELSSEWVDGYIPRPTIKDVLNGTLSRSRKQFGYNSRFWYPRTGGIEKLIFALQKHIKDDVRTEHRAIEIDLKKRTVIFQNGEKAAFNNLISSLPLPEMLKVIPGLPVKIKDALRKLRYTSIFCLNLGVDRENVSDKHWIYFPERKFVFFRAGFPSNFSSSVAPAGKSSLYVEVSYRCEKTADKKNLSGKILRDLSTAGILSARDKIEVCDPVDIKYAYIIYDRNYKACTEAILSYLHQHNVYPVGRYGRWKYMSMEETILDSRTIADKLLNENGLTV